MTLEYKVETNSLYRETEYGKEYDGSDYVDITFEPSRQELKDALTTIISKSSLITIIKQLKVLLMN